MYSSTSFLPSWTFIHLFIVYCFCCQSIIFRFPPLISIFNNDVDEYMTELKRQRKIATFWIYCTVTLPFSLCFAPKKFNTS